MTKSQSTPRPEYKSTKENDMDAFLQWMRDNGAVFSKVCIGESKPASRGVFVQSNQLIEENETLITIPKSLMITTSTIGECDEQPGLKSFSSFHHSMASFILSEKRKGTNSFYSPWIRILPTFEEMGNIPSLWDEKRLEQLKGSQVHYFIKRHQREWKRDYVKLASEYSLSDYFWARSVVSSRMCSVFISGIRTPAIVPFADLFNHARNEQKSATWSFDEQGENFVVSSLETISGGQEIFIFYGNKPMDRMFAWYGFCDVFHDEDTIADPIDIMVYDVLFTVRVHTRHMLNDILMILQFLKVNCEGKMLPLYHESCRLPETNNRFYHINVNKTFHLRELGTWKTLLLLLKNRMEKFSRPVEQDQWELMHSTLDPSRIHILNVLIAEKQILAHLYAFVRLACRFVQTHIFPKPLHKLKRTLQKHSQSPKDLTIECSFHLHSHSFHLLHTYLFSHILPVILSVPEPRFCIRMPSISRSMNTSLECVCGSALVSRSAEIAVRRTTI